MENASKALIIAGAVLISILLISLGVMIYRNAADIANGNQMKDFEITAFNSKFTQYEGNKNGSQVKSMIQDCLSSNVNEENIDRLISVAYAEGADTDTRPDLGNLSGATVEYLLGAEVTNNNQGGTNSVSAEYSRPSTSKIKNGTTYEVTMHYSTSGSNKGLVDGILVWKSTS